MSQILMLLSRAQDAITARKVRVRSISGRGCYYCRTVSRGVHVERDDAQLMADEILLVN